MRNRQLKGDNYLLERNDDSITLWIWFAVNVDLAVYHRPETLLDISPEGSPDLHNAIPKFLVNYILDRVSIYNNPLIKVRKFHRGL